MADDKTSKRSFEQLAEGEEQGLIAEFVQFLKENKKWWLTPILLVLGLLAIIGYLGATGVAPFIYSLF